MILQVVAVRDRAADAFMRPFFVPTIGMAVRSFQDEVNRANPDNSMWVHPEDYDLYSLCQFDEDSGQFVSDGRGPRMVAVGKDCVKPKA